MSEGCNKLREEYRAATKEWADAAKKLQAFSKIEVFASVEIDNLRSAIDREEETRSIFFEKQNAYLKECQYD